MLYDSLNHVINAFSPQGCWGMVQEKGSQERCRNWTVLHAQCISVLFSGFPLSQGNAEALDRWGGKTKHCLISYFLSNTSAKNYRNRIVYAKIIESQMWDVFWDAFFVFAALTHQETTLIIAAVAHTRHLSCQQTCTFSQSIPQKKLECGQMPNVMANIGGALCWTLQSLPDAQCPSAVQ